MKLWNKQPNEEILLNMGEEENYIKTLISKVKFLTCLYLPYYDSYNQNC